MNNISTLKDKISDGDLLNRTDAINSFDGEITSEVLVIFRKTLSDESPKVRYATLCRLNNCIDNETIDTVTNLLYDANDTISIKAALILGTINSDGAAKVQKQLFKRIKECTGEQTKLKASIIQSLGRIASMKELSQLLPFLEDENDRVRANVIEAIDAVYRRDFEEHIDILLDDPNNRVRGNAIVSLWKYNPKRCIAVLEEMVNSENKWFKLSAIWAAGEIASPKTLQIVGELKDDEDTDVRILVMKTMASSSFFDCVNVLKAGVQDDDTTVSYYARKALDALEKSKGLSD